MPSAEPRSTAAWARRIRSERPPADLDEYLAAFEAFFDHHAGEVVGWRGRHAGYHGAVASTARFHVPPGARVLEIGSGTGDLLAALEPSYGVGVDLSETMVQLARQRHPRLHFLKMAAEHLKLPGETFDYVVLSDVLGYLYDIRAVFEHLAAVSHPRTRVVIHWYSRLWQPAIQLLERMGLKSTLPYLNWTTVGDVENLLRLAGFEVVRARGHVLLPLGGAPSRFLNRVVAHLPIARWFVWTNWVVARPAPRRELPPPRVSVICPCRNEAGNIESVVVSLNFQTEKYLKL